MSEVIQMPEVICRLKQVQLRTGLKRSSLYQKISDGTFPKQVKIGPRAVGWLDSEITKWVQQCVESSRKNRGEK